jgi:hypothetical protein
MNGKALHVHLGCRRLHEVFGEVCSGSTASDGWIAICVGRERWTVCAPSL